MTTSCRIAASERLARLLLWGCSIRVGWKVLKRWFRRALSRCGIEIPYDEVICPEHIKTIWVGPDWCARINVKRTLVFLDLPEDGDLRDTYLTGGGSGLETFVYDSPDAREVRREPQGRDSLAIHWKPNRPIIPYALYVHEDNWTPSASYRLSALYTEFRCDVRTGVFALEVITPARFEAGVVFKRPGWPRLNSERSLVKYALDRLEARGSRPMISDDGRRAEWTVEAPMVGAHYTCILFHEHGVADWQERLKQTSLVGRTRRWIGALAHR